MAFFTAPCRINWTKALFTPEEFDGNGKFKYSVEMIFNPEDAGVAETDKKIRDACAAAGRPYPYKTLMEIRKEMYDAMVKKFGPVQEAWPVLQMTDLKTHLSPNGKDGWPLRNGNLNGKYNEQEKKFIPYSGYAGATYMRASCSDQDKPLVFYEGRSKVTNQMEAILVTDPSKVPSGLIAVVEINPYAFSNRSSGVAVGLSKVLLLRDDDVRFSSTARPSVETVNAALSGVTFDDQGFDDQPAYASDPSAGQTQGAASAPADW